MLILVTTETVETGQKSNLQESFLECNFKNLNELKMGENQSTQFG